MDNDEITIRDQLEHELEEWKYLNSHINSMETGHMQSISLMLAGVTGILAFVLTRDTDASTAVERTTNWVFFLLPPILTVVLAYIGYQFRITAILRGHLARLERSMNEKLKSKDPIHLWNSALVEEFMAKNNEINSFLMVPSLFTILIMIVFSLWQTYETLVIDHTIFWGPTLFVIYWLIEFILAAVILYSFINNEKIRRTTDREIDQIVKNYHASCNQPRDTLYHRFPQKAFQIKFPNSLKSTLLSFVAVLCGGFGAMLLLWWNYQIRTVNALELPGLFDYRAATIGDAICLPLMVSSALMLLRGQKLSDKQTKYCLFFSAVAMLVGVLVQISWLLNPNINPNWTIPKAHYFNLAGWYHACFFVVMFGISALLATSIFSLLTKIPLHNKVVRLNFHLYFNVITLFLSLDFLDDYITDSKNYWSISIFFLLSLVAQFVLLRFINVRKVNSKKASQDTADVSSQKHLKGKGEAFLIGVVCCMITLCFALAVCWLWQ